MNHSTLPTGTITFLFTDIEGSTRLWQEHPGRMKLNLARHDQILRDCIERNQGHVFKTVGDAFCAAFPTALQGVKAALEAQLALSREDWGECVLKVRMGLHSGDAEQREEDYFGTTLNRTARLMSAGHGGQTLLSLAAQQLVAGSLPEGAALCDLGRHRLKDLVSPEQIFQLDSIGLSSDFPPLRTLDIQRNNLPTQLTHFVGRERETAAVQRLLDKPDVRLVTLSGAGGTGKTRLSLQVAANLLDEFEDGVWFVELASISDPGLFLPTVAATLKVREIAGRSITGVLQDYLSDKQLLLVLDNFEQIVSAATDISAILAASPRIKILVSSREVLRLRGEHDYPVPPLGLPESKRRQTAAVLAQYEAIALFTQHAQAADASFELNEENANIVAEICMKLDGLPLAIELAAARSRLLKPAAMLDKLKNKLDMLTGGPRDLPRRQQTMRGAIDWSHDLLDDVEKKLFARLGIFAGGWTFESAEAVCGSGVDVMNGIESLLDKSLIRQVETNIGKTRFRMLETIREYAHEKLSQSGELASIQQAHADYLEQFLQMVIAAHAKPEEEEWFVKLDDDLENLRLVMEWALTQKQPSYVFTIARLYQYWSERSNYREPLNWLKQALTLDGGTITERARALNCAGNILNDLNEYQQARTFYEDSLTYWRQADDSVGATTALANLGNIAWVQDKDYHKAQMIYKEALAALENEPDMAWNQAMTLNNLGSISKILQNYDAALGYYARSREICINLGAETGVSFADWFLGRLALAQRKLDEAQMHFESQLKASWFKSNPLVFRYAEVYIGYIHLLRGHVHEAK
jgi:predicted ATPase/class 3 adenylate cyclase